MPFSRYFRALISCMRVRPIIASSLLLLLAMPLLVLSFLQLKQAYIKHEMEERLEAGLLKTFFVPKEKWYRLNSREIVVANKLFDLKECRAVTNGFVVTGVFDDEETAVLHQLDRACQQNNPKDGHLLAQVFQLLHGFFFQSDAEPQWIPATRPQLFQNPIPHLSLHCKPVLCPPPRALA